MLRDMPHYPKQIHVLKIIQSLGGYRVERSLSSQNDLIYVQQVFYTKPLMYVFSIHAKGFELFTLPGCVCQGEAPLAKAPVHQEFAKQQRRVTGGVSRRITRGHPGGSAGWARSWLRFHLDGLSAAEWERISLPGAFPEGFTHVAMQRFSRNIRLTRIACADLSVLTGSPDHPSQSSRILQ